MLVRGVDGGVGGAGALLLGQKIVSGGIAFESVTIELEPKRLWRNSELGHFTLHLHLHLHLHTSKKLRSLNLTVKPLSISSSTFFASSPLSNVKYNIDFHAVCGLWLTAMLKRAQRAPF